MFALIDLDNKRALAKHESYVALAALAYIQFANADTLVMRLTSENKCMSVLDGATLRGVCEALGQPVPPGKDYGAITRHARPLLEKAEHLTLPFDASVLYAQAASIPATCSTPYAFNPNGGEPDKLAKWHAPPYRNRPRHECPHFTHFTTEAEPPALQLRQNSAAPWNPSMGDGTMPARASRATSTTTENTMATKKPAAPAAPAKKTAKAAPAAPKAAAPKAAKAPKAEKAPKAPKAERVEQNGAKRPKAGTTGDKIWSTADTLSAKKKSPASFDELAKALGDSVNESSMRAGYQRWRKFNGLKGRLAAAE